MMCKYLFGRKNTDCLHLFAREKAVRLYLFERKKSARVGDRHRKCAGQMTIEFAVAMPVFIAIALIATNAMLFFSECAAFDRISKDAARVCATSPAYGQTIEQSRAQIQNQLEVAFDKPYLASRVSVSEDVWGHCTFTSTLEFSPTLFGLGLKSEVFGVSLPHLEHESAITIDVYKPGVLL
jgi:choline dehydrogenase-like flavoprotein